MSLESVLADLVVAVNKNTEASLANANLLALALQKAPAAATKPAKTLKVEEPKAEAPIPAPAPAPKVEEPKAETPAPAPAPAPKVEEPKAEVTQQDIIDLATEVLASNGKDTAPLVALAEKYKIKRIREIDTARMGAMKADLLALIAAAKAS
jgi:outer membrane biosynthesis protein TonB